MNFRRYLLSAFAVFVFIFLYDMLLHGFVLADIYAATPGVWRDFSEAHHIMLLSALFQLVLSAWLAFIFSQIYKEGGVKNGLRFGLGFGVLAGIFTGSWYLWLNVPAILGFSWFISGIGEGIGVGLVLGSIYRK